MMRDGSERSIRWSPRAALRAAMLRYHLVIVPLPVAMLVVVLWGVLLANLGWPALVGSVTLLVFITDKGEFLVPTAGPAIVGAAFRWAWGIRRARRR